MNMILCSENCKHQMEGYCALEGPSKLSGSTLSTCAYYERRSAGLEESAKKPERFSDLPNRH